MPDQIQNPMMLDEIQDFIRTGEPLDLSGRIVPADSLRNSLLTVTDPNPKGLRLIGAVIQGRLDFENTRIPFPLSFESCTFGEVIATSFVVTSLSFANCELARLDLDGAALEGSLILGIKSDGQIRLGGCKIGGQLVAKHANLRLAGPEPALFMDSSSIAGGVFFRDGFVSEGQISMTGCRIGGELDLTNAILNYAGHESALSLNKSTIEGTVSFAKGFTSKGRLCLIGATIGRDLAMRNATLIQTGNRPALELDTLTLGGNANLNYGFSSTGEVSMVGCHITGSLDMAGAKLLRKDGVALNMNKAVVDGSVYLRNKFWSGGQIRLDGCRVGGQFEMTDATIFNALRGDETALTMDGSTIGRSVFLDKSFWSSGTVSLRGCQLHGALKMTGATLFNSTERERAALVLDGATIEHGVWIDRGFCAKGNIEMRGCRVNGPVDVSGAAILRSGFTDRPIITVDNSEIEGNLLFSMDDQPPNSKFKSWGKISMIACTVRGDLAMTGADLYHAGSNNRTSLELDKSYIGGDLRLDGSFRSWGRISLVNCHVGSQLTMRGATVMYASVGSRSAVNMDRSTVLADAFFDGDLWVGGRISMVGCQIGGAFMIEPESPIWNGALIADLNYKIPLSGALYESAWHPDARLMWLRNAVYASSAYRTLARLYSDHGYQDAADQVLIAMHVDRRHHYPFWRRMTDALSACFTGYGYKPIRLLGFMLGTLLFTGVIFSISSTPDYLVTTVDGIQISASGAIIQTPPGERPVFSGCTPDASIPCWSSMRYALDTIVPIADLGQRTTWKPNTNTTAGRSLSIAIAVLSILGWVYTLGLGALAARWFQGKYE